MTWVQPGHESSILCENVSSSSPVSLSQSQGEPLRHKLCLGNSVLWAGEWEAVNGCLGSDCNWTLCL